MEGGHHEVQTPPPSQPLCPSDALPSSAPAPPPSPDPLELIFSAACAEGWTACLHAPAVLLERRRRFLPLLRRTRLAAAPMVGVSDLAFRLLCRRFGASICYTEMIDSQRLVQDSRYAARMLLTDERDRPLVVQLASNHSEQLLAAALEVQDRMERCGPGVRDDVAICLNLGCQSKPHSRILPASFTSAEFVRGLTVLHLLAAVASQVRRELRVGPASAPSCWTKTSRRGCVSSASCTTSPSPLCCGCRCWSKSASSHRLKPPSASALS